jgi:threonine synthase
VLRAVRETDGAAVAVPDEEMLAAANELRETEGIPAGVEGGACLAALRRLRRDGRLRDGETVVLFNTGNLQNY